MQKKNRFRVEAGGLQYRALHSRAKIQMVGGGFGNGKTALTCIKILEIAQKYPGANILIARATLRQVNSTIRKEFLKWCPEHWIGSFPQSEGSSNTCTLVNGTTVVFGYLAQIGRGGGGDTSTNLLSATYDVIAVDQIEDPAIMEKDFEDMLGRLRGNTPLADKADTEDGWPATGPRWLLLTSNPSGNWVYTRLVRPMHIWQQEQRITPELLCVRDTDGVPVLGADGKPQLLMELFEGATHENAHNLDPDFIQTLESTYTGQMRDRFILGIWADYEGLVYPMFDKTFHCLSRGRMRDQIRKWQQKFRLKWIEGFDFGISSPSCYLLACISPFGDVFVIDGFYEPQLTPEQIYKKIQGIRLEYHLDHDVHRPVLADPAIFKGTNAGRKTVGESTAALIWDDGMGVHMVPGNNDRHNGIVKIGSFLTPHQYHLHPILNQFPAPYLYFAAELEFVQNEFATYKWKTKTRASGKEDTIDRDDHAMDCLRYLLSHLPRPSGKLDVKKQDTPEWLKWNVLAQEESNPKGHRYG